jgi:hypothetical protein
VNSSARSPPSATWSCPRPYLQCRTDEDGSLKLIVDSRQGDGEYGVTGLARRQLADTLEIPFAYFERMRIEQPNFSIATSTPGCNRMATAG